MRRTTMANDATIQLHREELDLIEKLVDNHFMKTLAQNFEENPDGFVGDDFAMLIVLRAKIKFAAAKQKKEDESGNG
jgi:hypothetical protein